MKADRNVVLELLEKMGATFTTKISVDRAVKKLQPARTVLLRKGILYEE